MPTKQVRFNIKNLKYAIKTSGTYGTPVAYAGTSKSISLDNNVSKKIMYGDGRAICTVLSDKGKNGSVTVNIIDDTFETAMKRKLVTANGKADIQQMEDITCAIYFETESIDDSGARPLTKTWLLGVHTQRPAEGYTQNTDDINESQFEMPLEIFGEQVMAAGGTTPYKDDDGNEVYAWQITVTTGDSNFSTFESTVALPVMAGGG
jgi:hypothetical protein